MIYFLITVYNNICFETLLFMRTKLMFDRKTLVGGYIFYIYLPIIRTTDDLK